MGNCCPKRSKQKTSLEEGLMDEDVTKISIAQINRGESNDDLDMSASTLEINIGGKKRKPAVSMNDFKIIKVIGKGSFAKVLLVEKNDTKELLAMKILKKDVLEKKKQVEHTKAERYILENMEHPFILQLHFAFQTRDKLYMIVDFMQGGEMFFHLRKQHRLDERATKFYGAQIVLALEYLHSQNIIYRDLKPENILLDGHGYLKIADFGLSKLGIEFGQKSYTFCGTPEYSSPEVLQGMGHDKAVDWWSLGSVLYEMLTGAPPWYNPDRQTMFHNIIEKPVPMKPFFSPEATSLLTGLLQIDPNNRLGSSERDARDVKAHPFFKDINWDKLLRKEITAPFVPKLNGPADLKYFDRSFTDEPIKDTPVVSHMPHGDQYEGFSYMDKTPLGELGQNEKVH